MEAEKKKKELGKLALKTMHCHTHQRLSLDAKGLAFTHNAIFYIPSHIF